MKAVIILAVVVAVLLALSGCASQYERPMHCYSAKGYITFSTMSVARMKAECDGMAM